jgi:hypothetical protein
VQQAALGLADASDIVQYQPIKTCAIIDTSRTHIGRYRGLLDWWLAPLAPMRRGRISPSRDTHLHTASFPRISPRM